MISRRILIALLLPLPVLIVAFGVLMGAAALAFATQDALGAKILKWVAIADLLVLVIDLLLLVLALGINAVEQGRNDERRQ